MEFYVVRTKKNDDVLKHDYDPEYRKWYYENYEKKNLQKGRDKSPESTISPAGWIRGRSRTSNMTTGSQITANKFESATPRPAQFAIKRQVNGLMSDADYAKKKTELDEKEWIDAYDFRSKSETHIRREDFPNHIKSLVEKGINPKLQYMAPDPNAEDTEAEARRVQEQNALIRYWNELAEKAMKEKETDKPKLSNQQTHAVQRVAKLDKEKAKKIHEYMNSRGQSGSGNSASADKTRAKNTQNRTAQLK